MDKHAITTAIVPVLLTAAIWSCTSQQSPVADFSHDYPRYTELLQRHVDTDGWVDYDGLIADSVLLRQAADALANLAKDSLEQFTASQKLALWINAYNLLTLKSVAEAYPVKSIKDIDGVWDKRRFQVGGRSVTLEDIEHRILRQGFNEPRIHFAIVCASISCPALRHEPYLAPSLSQQLRDATLRFLTDSIRNRFSPDFREAKLSQIFEWSGRDFAKSYMSTIPADQPKEIRAVLNFIAEALPDSIGRFLRDEEVVVSYLDYDWGLNSQEAARSRTSSSPEH
jgi:hypothetical protein